MKLRFKLKQNPNIPITYCLVAKGKKKKKTKDKKASNSYVICAVLVSTNGEIKNLHWVMAMRRKIRGKQSREEK